MPTEEQIEALKQLHKQWRIPPEDKVARRDNGKGVMLDYVGHATITDWLLEADPGWALEPAAADDSGQPVVVTDPNGNPVAMWCYLRVHGVRRLCVGTCLPTAREPLKELLGDALRNGAMRFGVALSLWSKEEWGEDKSPAKKTARATRAPKPEEAVAESLPAAATAPPAADAPVEERQNDLVERIKSLGVDQRASLREWMGREGIPEKPSALTVEHIVAIEQYIHMLGDTF